MKLNDELSNEQKQYFCVYSTQIPLTHSIGLYDDIIIVSEFCLDTASSHVPSYQVAKNSKSYKTFLQEVRILLEKGTSLFK